MPAEDLLSHQKRRNMLFAIEELKREFDKLDGEHMLISKYHERLWFQREMRKTKEELLERYRWLAYMLNSIEQSIDEFKAKLHAHYNAVEELHTSMDPFKGIDLKETPLIQQNLF